MGSVNVKKGENSKDGETQMLDQEMSAWVLGRTGKNKEMSVTGFQWPKVREVVENLRLATEDLIFILSHD